MLSIYRYLHELSLLFKSNKCKKCKGKGKILIGYKAIPGYSIDSKLAEWYEPCHACAGTGKLLWN